MKSIYNLKFRIASGLLLFLLGLGVFSALGFDSDNDSDVLWHYKPAPHPYNSVWLMHGVEYMNPGTNQALTIQETTANWEIVATADFNADRQTDLLWRDKTTGEMAIWLMFQNQASSFHVLPKGDVGYDVVGTGDFDGDGFTDILWRHKTLNLTVVWFMTGPSGTVFANRVGWVTSQPEPASWTAVATGDFNNDTHPDILWRHNSTGQLSIWYLNGTNKISSTIVQNQTVAADYQIACTGQFWWAGKTDILLRHTATTNNANKVWVMSDANYLGTAYLVYGRTQNPVPVPDQNWAIAGMGGYRTGLLLAATNLTDTSHTLVWKYGTHNGGTTIEHKKPGQNWTTLQTNYRPSRLTNSTQIAAGERYEYKFTYPSIVEPEWLSTGTRVAEVLNRGRALMLVDETLLTRDPTLSADFNKLEQDLVGDGWTVVKDLTAKRHDETIVPGDPFHFGDNPNRISTNKAKIISFHNAAPTANNLVLLIGHIAVPYSGLTSSDSHSPITPPDHRGAWSADAYYADVDNSLWHDSSVNFENTGVYWKASNRPGDGKFDEDFLPSDPELGVGRIDFYNLPNFSLSETALIRQYLQKVNRYRNKVLSFSDSAQAVIAEDAFPPQTYENALRLASRAFGLHPGSISHNDYFISGTPPHLWGCLAGSGGNNFITGRGEVQHTTASLNSYEPQIGFHMLKGSFFADWNLDSNNILRGLLATPNYGLAALGLSDNDGNARWHLEGSGLGDPIGIAFLAAVKTMRTMGVDRRWLALLGDPTLRLQVTAPPTNPAWNPVNNTLSWSAPSQEIPGSYLVEFSVNGLAGPWSLLAEVTAPSVQHGISGSRMYRVRAKKLVVTGSGSFQNLSQGILKSVP